MQDSGPIPTNFPGGQRQRAMIAMALANNPELLVADEPTTALDVTVQAQVIDLLKSLQRQFKMTVDHVKAVDGITIRVRQGHSLGIVGESGSGKTTLGLAILRLVRSNGGIVFQKSAIDGYNQKQMRSLRKEMQVVFQDPFGSLSPRMSIAKIIEEGLESHRPADKAGFEAEIIKVLEEVDLDPDVRHRYPHEFSGGQRQRIAIARALVLKPKLLVLDEPTSSLDRSVQFQVINLLKDLQLKYGLTYLFITHDLKIVKALCHDVIVMKSGVVVEAGSALEVFEDPQRDYTRALLSAAFN
jgi:microcin C transport system ATP-binding protein